MSDSLDDPFIVALMDEFGPTGYVVWFGLIEIIAKENGAELTGKLSVSPTYLRRKLRTSSTKLRQVFDYCQGFTRLSVTFCEKEWHFEFPKIAEIKDNYTKDLQAAGKKPSNHKEVEAEKEEDKEKDSRKFKEGSEPYKLSCLLFDTIRKRDPVFTKPDFQRWSLHIDRLVRLDKRTPEVVRKVIVWCQADEFWHTNIQSAAKLRIQFSQLLAKMNAQKGPGSTLPVEEGKYDGRG